MAKTITLRGIKYDLITEDHLEGFADVPLRRQKRRKRDIYIDSHLKGTRRHMEVALHEGLHALTPDSPEPWVEMSAHQLARLLWSLGYRLS